MQQFARDRDKLDFFLTYADNNAVTFFAKQGFTTEVTSRRDRVSSRSQNMFCTAPTALCSTVLLLKLHICIFGSIHCWCSSQQKFEGSDNNNILLLGELSIYSSSV